MIGGHPDMGRAILEKVEERAQDAAQSTDLVPIHVQGARHGEEVPEDLIGAVDQMHVDRRAGRCLLPHSWIRGDHDVACGVRHCENGWRAREAF